MHFAFIFVHSCLNLIFFLSIAFLYRTSFSLTCRYRNNEHENDSANSLGLDFERVVYASEFSNNEGMKYDNLSPNFLRLVTQNEK